VAEQSDNDLVRLQLAITRLNSAKDFDQLCCFAVKAILEDLGFDRAGVLLYDQGNQQQVGTWGTDAKGRMRDEHNLRLPIDDSLETQPHKAPNHIIIKENHPLIDLGKVVSHGWHLQCAIHDYDELLGWLFIDNLTSSKLPSPNQKAAINLFAKIVGPLMMNFKQNEELLDKNKTLFRVNNHFEVTLTELHETQKKLVEGEKMASLGRLVAGIAHELNTPLGNATTSISDVNFTSKILNNQLRNSTEDIRDSIEHMMHGIELCEKNVIKASKLVKNFRSIAIDNNVDNFDEVNLTDFVPNLVQSLVSLWQRKEEIQLNINVDPSLTTWRTSTGALTQIFTHLVDNAFQHAFISKYQGHLILNVERLGSNEIQFKFHDDGKGVTQEQLKLLFDPFYTTNRQTGSGLGTSIVYNIVVQNLKGTIEAFSNENGGLSYTICLPNLAGETKT